MSRRRRKYNYEISVEDLSPFDNAALHLIRSTTVRGKPTLDEIEIVLELEDALDRLVKLGLVRQVGNAHDRSWQIVEARA